MSRSKEIIIEGNGPTLFEMDLFIEECAEEYLSKYRHPVIPNAKERSKFKIGQVIDRISNITSILNWYCG